MGCLQVGPALINASVQAISSFLCIYILYIVFLQRDEDCCFKYVIESKKHVHLADISQVRLNIVRWEKS